MIKKSIIILEKNICQQKDKKTFTINQSKKKSKYEENYNIKFDNSRKYNKREIQGNA